MRGRVLVVAGSDSGGGAGIQADVKTITALGGYAATAITALTAQNMLGVQGVLPVPPEFIRQQVVSVLSDLGADAVKTGMLGNAAAVELVAAVLAEHARGIPLVLDPVMVAKGGARLLDEDAVEALRRRMFPLAALVTPNVPEAEALAGTGLAVERDGRRLFEKLDIAVGAGEWVAVTGPSGCGKTTLGNVLLGLLPSAAGVVRRIPGTARTRYQKLYQDPVATFAPRLPLRAALAEAAALHRVPWADVAATLARLRVKDALLDRRPDQVSGGELQRIAVARALLPSPVFLFADEPTSRLDPITQQDTMAVLRDVSAERGLAVLLVTHDAAMARKVSARQVVLGA